MLIWVDIIGRRIHRLDPQTLEHTCWDTPNLVTSIGLRKDGGAIVGLRKTVTLWDFGGPFSVLATIEPEDPGKAGFRLSHHFPISINVSREDAARSSQTYSIIVTGARRSVSFSPSDST